MRTVSAAKGKVGRPPRGRPPNPPMPWETKAVAKRVQTIIDSVEVSVIDPQVLLTLQRTLYRAEKYGDGDGSGAVTLLVRTITESTGNEDALIEPIISAVSFCMRPEWTAKGLAWIEAFDQIPLESILQTMRDLDLFAEASLGHYLGIAIRNKLAAIFEPLPPAAKTGDTPPRIPRARKAHAAVKGNVATAAR